MDRDAAGRPDERAIVTRGDQLDAVSDWLRRGQSVGAACRSAGISQASYYRWRRKQDQTDRRIRDVDVRRDVIDVARRAFLAEGYDISMARIAALAGVARQTVYNLFGSKRTLLRAVLEDVYSELTVMDPENERSSSIAALLAAFGRRYLALATDPDAVGLNRLMIAQAARDSDVSGMVMDLARERAGENLRDRLASRLDALARTTAGAEYDGMAIAAAFQSAAMGMPRLRALIAQPPARDELDRHLACVVAIFLGGIGLGDPGSEGGDPLEQFVGRDNVGKTDPHR